MSFLTSISSFFGGGNNAASTSRQARRAAVNSTFDAFQLPQSSARYADGPSLGMGVHDNMSETSSPGPSRRASTAYAYPPRETYQPSTNLYQPLSHTFNRLRKALAESFPELLETLNGPVDPTLLAAFEQELGCPLPPPVRDTFLIADGQDQDAGSNGLFFGLHFLPLEEVAREWAFWRRAEHDPDAGQNPALLATMASVPPTWIKGLYACRGWLPLISDRTGNYVGVDLDPGPGGSFGQVIVFGRDFDRKCVLWRGDGETGWGKWFSGFVDELESGEGWEADRSNSSDEEEELGYSSYNGGALAGEGGKGLRLAGEYRGWNVLEAWWDRSVRQWEQLGLGLDVEEIERGMLEARRLAGWNDAEPEANVAGPSGTTHEVPVMGSPQMEAPNTPTPADSDILLPPESPQHPINRKAPVRIITPVASTSKHPLEPLPDQDIGLLTPPNRRRHRVPPPAPTQLDLPTRADVQAMTAIAQAEASGLRGGWVMNIDTGRPRRSVDAEMVDIDLEGGRGERFGTSKWDRDGMVKRREEEKAAIADRSFPPLISTRTPSPLSRGPSEEHPTVVTSPVTMIDATPRVHQRDSVLSTSALRPPPPVASHSDITIRGRANTPDEDRDREVVRHIEPMNRKERESSVISTGSQDGLLDSQSLPSRSASPASNDIHEIEVYTHQRNGLGSGDYPDSLNSPTTIKGRRSEDSERQRPTHHAQRSSVKLVPEKVMNGLEDSMEEVSLGDVKEGAVMG